MLFVKSGTKEEEVMTDDNLVRILSECREHTEQRKHREPRAYAFSLSLVTVNRYRFHKFRGFLANFRSNYILHI